MQFDEIFKQLVERSGAVGCILMGFDGIEVTKYVNPDLTIDIELLGAEVTGIINQLRTLAIADETGIAHTVITEAGQYNLLFKVITEEYYLAMILPPQAPTGKAKFIINLVEPDLYKEIA